MPQQIEVEDRRRGDEEEVGGDVSRCSFKMAVKIKSLPLTKSGKCMNFFNRNILKLH